MIELWRSNMYKASGRLIKMLDARLILERELVAYEFSDQDQVYTVKEGDVIDSLSNAFYPNKGDDPCKLWWYIADVNKIVNPLDLSSLTGKSIIIPSYSNFQRYVN